MDNMESTSTKEEQVDVNYIIDPAVAVINEPPEEPDAGSRCQGGDNGPNVTNTLVIEESGKDSNETEGDLKNYEPRINPEWVQILIDLRMKHAKSFTRKRHSAANAWTNIYKEMLELGAPGHITVEKIKKKWMNLIARYKHFKFVVNANGAVSWPYYDQIDRAYAMNPNIIELRRNFNSSFKPLSTLAPSDKFDSDTESMTAYADSMMKRQQFTSVLIQLRCAYRHLFTGKKYAAQRGWMTVKNMHPDGDNYTVDQFSKCWQNLTQRYRTLLETEKDHSKITWMHFQTMHKVMEAMELEATESSSSAANSSITSDSGNVLAKSDVYDDEEDNNGSVLFLDQLTVSPDEPREKRMRPEKEVDEAAIDHLMKYLIDRDIRLDAQHEEVMSVLNSISKKLS